MNGLVMAAQLLLGLSILVILHEFGHFIAARAFGIRVEKFYLFFDAWGIKLFSYKKGDTEYGIGWLPLGGYVKISGMVDESMDKEQMKQPPQPWEFRAKPAWQRLIVMVGGVTMNVILGIAIYTYVLLHYSEGKYLPLENVKDGIYAYELGREAGLQTGDKIVSFNGEKVDRFEDLLGSKVLFGGTFTVNRNGKPVDVTVPGDLYKTVSKKGKGRFIGPDNYSFAVDSIAKDSPAEKAGLQKGDKIISVNDSVTGSYGFFREMIGVNKNKAVALKVSRGDSTLQLQAQLDSNAVLGIFATRPDYTLADYSVVSALRYGSDDAFETLVANAKGLKKIFTGEEDARESLQGPIGIATIYGSIWEWHRFWIITGLLSMILAFMNILPIPALDGGHVIFLVVETLTGKKFSDKFMEKAQVAGMIILISLMVFATGNDIWKHIIR
jgi:regulator of sigma E protease